MTRMVKPDDLRHLHSNKYVTQAGNAGIVFFNQETAATEADLRISLDELESALEAAGRETSAPPRIRESTLLRRCCEKYNNKHRTVKRLQGEVHGYQFADVSRGDDAVSLNFKPQFSIYLERGQLYCSREDSHAQEVYQEIRRQFYAQRDYLASTDVRSWLSNQALLAGSVKVMNRGYAYYIPPHQVESFQQLAQIVERLSLHRLPVLPVTDGPGVVAAVVAGLTEEIEQSIKTAQEQLQNGGKRAHQSHKDVMDALKVKVEFFEELLGCGLESLRAQIDPIKDELTKAILGSGVLSGRKETKTEYPGNLPDIDELLG